MLAVTNAHEDHVMLAVSVVMALAALGGLFGAVKLFKKNQTLAGVLILLASLGAGLVALGIGALVVLSWFAWH